MISITGNKGFDFFIMQSNDNKQKVKRDCDYYFQGDLRKCLLFYNLQKSDFTDSDWSDLMATYWVD